MDKIIKGDIYEKYICDILNNEGIAWLWKNIPEYHLLESNLINDLNIHRLNRKKFLNNPDNFVNPLRDTGVDVLLYKQNKYILVQCKNGYAKGLTCVDLAGFSIMMLQHDDKEGRVYYTNKLSTAIKENAINPRIKYIKLPLKNNNKQIKNIKNIVLYDYQKIALNNLKQYFKENNRGILNMPCGTGKTIISCHFAHDYDNIIIISPLKQYAEQNVNRYTDYYNDFEYLIIDSEGTREIDDVENFINNNKNKKLLFSCTFRSVDIINKFIDSLDNTIIIVDEFHNLSMNNIISKKD